MQNENIPKPMDDYSTCGCFVRGGFTIKADQCLWRWVCICENIGDGMEIYQSSAAANLCLGQMLRLPLFICVFPSVAADAVRLLLFN